MPLQEPPVVEPIAQPLLLPEINHPIRTPRVEKAMVETRAQCHCVNRGGLEFQGHRHARDAVPVKQSAAAWSGEQKEGAFLGESGYLFEFQSLGNGEVPNSDLVVLVGREEHVIMSQNGADFAGASSGDCVDVAVVAVEGGDAVEKKGRSWALRGKRPWGRRRHWEHSAVRARRPWWAKFNILFAYLSMVIIVFVGRHQAMERSYSIEIHGVRTELPPASGMDRKSEGTRRKLELIEEAKVSMSPGSTLLLQSGQVEQTTHSRPCLDPLTEENLNTGSASITCLSIPENLPKFWR
ncbi:hypothetical protein G2W53_012450 [Senna tora]|uniref:Uncharacterized protein n=1 Tax=Senna tora TaxID=362788 RepID=A0A834TXP6_9FABA|nr:hypothetical protein G2W53_012450 [Senna tora]